MKIGDKVVVYGCDEAEDPDYKGVLFEVKSELIDVSGIDCVDIVPVNKSLSKGGGLFAIETLQKLGAHDMDDRLAKIMAEALSSGPAVILSIDTTQEGCVVTVDTHNGVNIAQAGFESLGDFMEYLHFSLDSFDDCTLQMVTTLDELYSTGKGVIRITTPLVKVT